MLMRFIGEDSCGFRHGNIYDVYFESTFILDRPILLHCEESKTDYAVPYKNVETVFKNWEMVK